MDYSHSVEKSLTRREGEDEKSARELAHQLEREREMTRNERR